MKKVIYNQFGDENVLELAEVSVPAINENGLLVKVKAASINPLDWKIYGGEMKLLTGKKFPKAVGIDFSGIVEQTGSQVKLYQKGDEVMGLLDVFKGGALAEYIVVSEKDITTKPANISFEQAAALPVTGLAALQIVHQLAAISKGHEVLINGAAGGIGMIAIQVAKKQGAIVTAVAGSKGLALAKKWGAATAIDYAKENILTSGKQYDVVIDLSGKLPFKAARTLLKPKAVFVYTIPSPQALIGSFFHNLFSPQKFKILNLKPTKEGLHTLSGLAKEGLDILVDKVYPLADVKKAYSETSKSGVIGKAVINMN